MLRNRMMMMMVNVVGDVMSRYNVSHVGSVQGCGCVGGIGSGSPATLVTTAGARVVVMVDVIAV